MSKVNKLLGKRVLFKFIFLFHNQNTCCWYSKDPLSEAVLLTTHNRCKNRGVRKYSQFYNEKKYDKVHFRNQGSEVFVLAFQILEGT